MSVSAAALLPRTAWVLSRNNAAAFRNGGWHGHIAPIEPDSERGGMGRAIDRAGTIRRVAPGVSARGARQSNLLLREGIRALLAGNWFEGCAPSPCDASRPCVIASRAERGVAISCSDALIRLCVYLIIEGMQAVP